MLVSKRIQEVDIALPTEKLNALAARLVATGLLHPVDLPSSFPGEPNRRAQRQVYELENKLAKIEKYLAEIGDYTPLDPSISVELDAPSWEHAAEETLIDFQAQEEKMDQVIDSITRAKERLDSLRSLRDQLQPFRNVDVDLRWLESSRYLSFHLGRVPKVALERLLSKLSSSGAFVASVTDAGEEELAVILIVPLDALREAGIALREAGFQALQIPDEFPQNPSQAYEEVSTEIERFEERLEELRQRIRDAAPVLKRFYASLLTVKEALRIVAATRSVGVISFLKGFIPHGSLDQLKKHLDEAVGPGLYLLKEEREAPGAPVRKSRPTLVTVPKPLKPFQWIVNQYGTPAANEVVPTVLVAITFPLLYGLMFPDAGQALVIIAFGLYMLKTARGRESRENVGLLAIYLGAAAFVTGFLAGEFFGPLTGFKYLVWDGHPPMAPPIEGGEGGDTIWLLMTIAFRIAAFMLISGTLFGVVNALMERDYESALLAKLPKFVAFTSATFPFLVHDVQTAGAIINNAVFGGATSIEAALVRYGTLGGLLALFLLEPLYELVKHGFHGFKSRLGIGFLELFETVLLIIGNTASFLRIVGVSLAHAGIMFGFALLAKLVGGGIVGSVVGFFIYLFGNILAIGLEGIIVYAQTLRLHYYEWFTKFFTGAGIPFQPAHSPVRFVVSFLGKP